MDGCGDVRADDRRGMKGRVSSDARARLFQQKVLRHIEPDEESVGLQGRRNVGLQ